MIRSYDTDLRAAFDESSKHARAIANHIVACVDVPDELLAEYARTRGVVDRLVDELAGAERHASYYGDFLHAGSRIDCRICPALPPAPFDEPTFGALDEPATPAVHKLSPAEVEDLHAATRCPTCGADGTTACVGLDGADHAGRPPYFHPRLSELLDRWAES